MGALPDPYTIKSNLHILPKHILGLKINVDKTKCMVFNKSGRHIRCAIPCGNTVINSTREYKYLGFIVTPSGEVNTGIKDLKSRAIVADINN